MNRHPLRIGIDARLVYYRSGGISNYIQQIVSELAEIDRVNHYVIGESRKASVGISPHFPRIPLWTPCHHRIEQYALSVELLRLRLDVWHAPDFIPPLRGARHHVITVHDLNFIFFPQFLTPDSRRYYNDQIHTATAHADHILTISEASKRDIVDVLDIAPERVTVHYCGVGSNFTPQSPERCALVRRELDLPPRYLLFVGTFEPRKNIGGLVTAYADLVQQQPDLPPLVLAGQPGWLFAETQAQIDALHLADRVLFRRFDYAQLPALYTMADLLILPSFYEGFGLPPLEAMACGTIPVVSQRSSLPEVVGDVGVMVDPDDPASIGRGILTALADDLWRQRMTAAGIERARQFTWRQAAEIARSVYEAVVS